MKLGKGTYDFMKQVFPFIPGSSTLKTYGDHDRGSKDGFMYETARQFKYEFNKYYSSLEEKGKIDSSWGEPFIY